MHIQKTVILKNCGVAALLFAVTLLLQSLGGAYRCEFGGHPDEAAHYVTGLMIRDYIASGFHGSPMRFAETYYDHYPKVALGNWPPGFYLIQCAWTIPFSPSRTSVLLLMSVLTTMVAFLVFRTMRRHFSFGEALIGGVLFIVFPLTQRHTAMVMTEVPIALLSFAALCSFIRYLETERTRDAVLFGALASAAVMTKGSGLFLGLVPVLSLLYTRKFHLLRRLNFWYPAVIVLVFCGPWTWLFRKQAKAGWMESSISWHFTKQALVFYPKNLVLSTGYLLAGVAAVGIIAAFLCPKTKQETEGNGSSISWIVFASALLGLLVFHCIIPAGLEDRHLVPALPLLIVFIFSGLRWITKRFPSRFARPAVIGLAMALFLLQTFSIPQKGYAGFQSVAEQLLTKAPSNDVVFFVSSDAQGEGMFISELAMREKRPGHTVRRGSKLLASSTWSGSDYQAKFKDAQALTRFLLDQKIGYVVIDNGIPWYNKREHHEVLSKAAKSSPENFIPEANFPVQRRGVWTNGISVYRLNSLAGGH